ncbi:MAG TPA: recombinase family protein [Desulfosporosinus sp.]|nr:recombinase family protein [Desulfosporosinus sp.]
MKASAVILVRDGKVEDLSIDEQIKAIHPCAVKNGDTISDDSTWVVEVSKLVYSNAIYEIERQGLKRVYIYSEKYLGRKAMQAISFIKTIRELGSEIWTADNNHVVDGQIDLILEIEKMMSFYEKDELVKRLAEGKRRARAERERIKQEQEK